MSESKLEQAWGKRWPAPAKLNLMLRITGRREDGYHLLQTVFQMTDLCDWLTFHPVADGSVSLRKAMPGVPEHEDLTVRAANLLKHHTGCEKGVCIEVEKRLPMGGGLGGGSSDAATVLVVLNVLWELGLSKEKLMELGLQLGADVPVFVFGCSAWGEGVGEKLQALSLPEQWVVILKPECHVNTGQIFLSEGLTRNSKVITISDFIEGVGGNDCCETVVALYPEIAKAMHALSLFGEAQLTGTGACIYALFSDAVLAKQAFEELRQEWNVFLAKTLTTSPLYSSLEHG